MTARDFFDGKLVHNGKIYQLGRKGYSTGFASGNIKVIERVPKGKNVWFWEK